MKKLFSNFLFYFLFLFFSILVIPVFCLCFALILIFTPRRFALKFLRWAILIYGKIIIFGIARFFIDVSYKNLGSKISEPSVFVINHRSASDAFLLACLTGEIVQVANNWPFKLPVLGFFASCAGYLNVKEMSYELFEVKCTNLLNSGVSIAVFPEGTRSGNKLLAQFHGAAFRVVLKNKCPIIPVCIMGSEDKPKRNSLMLHPGKIYVHALKSFKYDDYKKMIPFKLKKHIRNLMNEYIIKTECEKIS